jgi:hypothetical protein
VRLPNATSRAEHVLQTLGWPSLVATAGLAQVVNLLSIIAKLFLRETFSSNSQHGAKSPSTLQDVSRREARQDPIAEATEPASGTIFNLTWSFRRVC